MIELVSSSKVEPILDQIDRARLRADTEALTAIAPRIGGTPGEQEARAWVEASFHSAGLSHVHLERIFYPRWTCQGWSLRLEGQELEALSLHGSGRTTEAGLTAPLMDLGAGQAEDYDRFCQEELRGKFHLAATGLIFRRRTVLRAERAGAAGVVLINPQSEYPEAGTAQIFGKVPIFAVGSATGERLRRAALGSAALTMKVRCRYRPGVAFNVVGEIPGDSPEYVILAAHYDAWHAGAADNAAGVAVLLELARLWRGRRLRHRLRFVSYAAEEEGCMGSLFHAFTRLPAVKLRCKGVITPDVVGPRTEALYISGEPREARRAAVELLRGTGYRGAEIRENMLGAFGDYWPYTRLGIPGLMLSKMPYPHYHTPEDTPSKLDYDDLAWTAAMVGMLANELPVNPRKVGG